MVNDPHKDLRIVVTGAASGIGRACAARLAAAGARVVGLDLRPGNGDWHMVAADLTQEAEVVRAMEAASAHLGGLDVVVNCAGIDLESPLSSFDLDAFDRMVAVNVRGTILVAREALRHFGEHGRIINTASELAYLGRAGASGYCATKGAIISLTRSWARELAPRVLVNAVAPGPVDTPLLNFAAMNAAQQALETTNPLGRIGKPEEIAEAVLFLASRATGFITGQCISVDGGAGMH
ncbi:SDR family oxidoreductase [Starkeya sp. ORNL1]|uniref:SDR family NAD(P)-dependent oxidoreductase n=1 Tax=Starkeya sp. ORNL1 TaxID=2709380 RepID=UPI001FEF28B2|nr:SDR family oxidoreductase [Starkeya sp. ORNL1]